MNDMVKRVDEMLGEKNWIRVSLKDEVCPLLCKGLVRLLLFKSNISVDFQGSDGFMIRRLKKPASTEKLEMLRKGPRFLGM